jgi:hypothetical protein
MSTSNIIFIVAVIVVVAALVIWIVTISARAKRMSAASDAQLAIQLEELAANPPAAPLIGQQHSGERSESVMTTGDDDASSQTDAASTKEGRLAELAALHAKGVISDDELTVARAKILAE